MRNITESNDGRESINKIAVCTDYPSTVNDIS
jgi:hypothetical protein